MTALLLPLLLRFMGERAAKWVAGLLPVLLVVAAVVGLWWHVTSKINGQAATIAAQKSELLDLNTRLAAETLARTKDVAGLTTLAQGTAAAAVKTRTDTAILGTVIDAKNPAPASAGLADLMRCLRDADTGGRQCAPTAGAGSAPAR